MQTSFKETAETFLSGGERLRPFHPFPTASQRGEYEKLPQALRQKLITLGEQYLNYPYPAIRATDFMAFKRTGNRVDYEDIYFARRYALNSLVTAECVENQGRFTDDIINGIFAICEESAWQLPPHNSYPDNPAQAILPDTTRPVLDLFACETGALLACVYYLLGEQLDAVSPFITKRIRKELEQRIITPYLTEHFWWMGRGEEKMCNWTPWCTQNVLLTVFLCAGAPGGMPGYSEETGRTVIAKAAESCDYFLQSYGEDGCCDEGPQYYRHAGLCLDGAANVLNQVTGDAFADLMTEQKIRYIAAYIYHVHVDGQYYINFADCSPIAGRSGVREYLFGKHTRQPKLMRFAAEEFRAGEDELFTDESHLLNLFYRMQTVFCYEEIKAAPDTLPPMGVYEPVRDMYYPSVGLHISRNETFCLAVKAGDNNDSHNHNDVGSIILYKNGHPVLVDIGVESYTQKTFSDHRYDLWTMQSCYHNLPTIDGVDQHAGAEYHACNVRSSLETIDFWEGTSPFPLPPIPREYWYFPTDNSLFAAELSGAYPLSTPERTYRRTVLLDKSENYVELTDTTNCKNVILNFITYDKPDTEDGLITVGDAEMTYQGAELLEVETLPITDKRLQTAWDHDLYRIRLKMDAPQFVMQIQ